MTVLRIQNLAQVMRPKGREESQIPKIEDKGTESIFDPFSLPYNQSLLSSTQDSIASLATPQEADLEDEQIRALLASPRYLQER